MYGSCISVKITNTCVLTDLTVMPRVACCPSSPRLHGNHKQAATRPLNRRKIIILPPDQPAEYNIIDSITLDISIRFEIYKGLGKQQKRIERGELKQNYHSRSWNILMLRCVELHRSIDPVHCKNSTRLVLQCPVGSLLPR